MNRLAQKKKVCAPIRRGLIHLLSGKGIETD